MYQDIWLPVSRQLQEQESVSWTSDLSEYQVEFEVLVAWVVKSSIFWDITTCIPLKVSRRFGGNVSYLSTVYTALYPKIWNFLRTQPQVLSKLHLRCIKGIGDYKQRVFQSFNANYYQYKQMVEESWSGTLPHIFNMQAAVWRRMPYVRHRPKQIIHGIVTYDTIINRDYIGDHPADVT
jgi:hypothetical protein